MWSASGSVGLPGAAAWIRSRMVANSRSASSISPAARVNRRSRSARRVLGDVALVADVVLELRPRVLQHGPHLDAGAVSLQGRELGAGQGLDQQVPAGVAEAPRPRGLLAQVAVVEDGELVVEHLRDGRDVAVDVGDDADADLVGDLLQRVRVERAAALGAVGLRRERRDALGAAGDAEVVDAGVVEQHLDERDVRLGGGGELRAGAPHRRGRPRAPVPARAPAHSWRPACQCAGNGVDAAPAGRRTGRRA